MVESLFQLWSQCEGDLGDARLEACIAAGDLVGGSYPDPDRFWFDACQDLRALLSEQFGRCPVKPVTAELHEAVVAFRAREGGEFLERVNYAIRSWELRYAEPDEEGECDDDGDQETSEAGSVRSSDWIERDCEWQSERPTRKQRVVWT